MSLSAVEELEEMFGSLDQMQKALTGSGGVRQVKAMSGVLEIMLAAGHRYCSNVGAECPEPLKCRPADIIDVTDKESLTRIMDGIFGAMRDDSERTVETRSKN